MSEYIKWISVRDVDLNKDRMIPGGYEQGGTTFIARRRITLDSISPGKAIAIQVGHQLSGYFVDVKRTRIHETLGFEVATGDEREFKWVAQSGPFNKFNVLASGGVPVDTGFEPVNDGFDMNPLYVARAPASRSGNIDIICGWVSEGAAAVISYDSEVHAPSEYEVLVYTGPSSSPPKPFPLHLTNYCTRLIASEYIKWVDYEKGSRSPVEGMIPYGISDDSTIYIARTKDYSTIFPGYFDVQDDRCHAHDTLKHTVGDRKFQIATGDERNFKWVAQSGRFNRSSILESGCIPVEVGHTSRSLDYVEELPLFSARARLSHEGKDTDFAYGWVREGGGERNHLPYLDHNGEIVEVTEYEVLVLCISTPPSFPQLPSSMPWLPSPLPDELPPPSPQPEFPPALPELPPALPVVLPALPELPPSLPELPLSSPQPEASPALPEIPPPLPVVPPAFPEFPSSLPGLPSFPKPL